MRIILSATLLLSTSLVACVDSDSADDGLVPTEAVAHADCRGDQTGPWVFSSNADLFAPTAATGHSTNDAYTRRPENTACASENTIVRATFGATLHESSKNLITVDSKFQYGDGGSDVDDDDRMTQAMCENSTLTFQVGIPLAGYVTRWQPPVVVHGTWTLNLFPNEPDKKSYYSCSTLFGGNTVDLGHDSGAYMIAAQVVRGLPENHHGYGDVTIRVENDE